MATHDDTICLLGKVYTDLRSMWVTGLGNNRFRTTILAIRDYSLHGLYYSTSNPFWVLLCELQSILKR